MNKIKVFGLAAAIVLILLGAKAISDRLFVPCARMEKSSNASYRLQHERSYDMAAETEMAMPAMAKSRALGFGASRAQAGPGNVRTMTAFTSDRKLAKSAEVSLEVKNCEETSSKLAKLINGVSGIIIDSQIRKYPGESVSGFTVAKVLPKDFEIVLAGIKKMGRADLDRVTSEDVTEEYVDLDARLKNYEQVRDRLIKILEDKAYKVTDILAVEAELTRVGGAIEQIKGRIKYLDRQVDMYSIRINYHEPKRAVPEDTQMRRGFRETIRIALESFIGVFNGIIVVIAVILPILIWIAIIGGVVFAIQRLMGKK